MNSKALIIISFFAFLFSETFTQSTCTLISEAQELVSSSPCFAKVQDLISCMTECEQKVWVTALKSNTESTKCFSCGGIEPSVKECHKNATNAMAKQEEYKIKQDRAAFSCYQKAKKILSAKGTDETSTAQIDFDTKDIVQAQKTGAMCQCKFLQKLQNVLYNRRNFLCSNISTWSEKSVLVANKVDSIYFQEKDATTIVDSFLNYWDCKSNSNTAILTLIQNITEAFANTPTCQQSARLLEATKKNSTSTNNESANKGINATSIIQLINNIASAGKTSIYTDFLTNFAKATADITTIACVPGGFERIISNIKKSSELAKISSSLNRQSGTCSGTYIIRLTGNVLECEGTCPGNFTRLTLEFKNSTNVPANYYFIKGCSPSGAFWFSYFSDLFDSTKVYSNFQYNGLASDGTTKISFDYCNKLLSNINSCRPGKVTATDGLCPIDTMNSKCRNEIESKCSNTILSVPTSVSTSSYPPACDQTLVSSADFLTTCLTYIGETYLKKTLILDSTAIAQLDVSTAESTSSSGRLRMLGTSYTIVNNVETSDNTFSGEAITANDLTIDGSTSELVGDVSVGVSEVTQLANERFLKLLGYIYLIFFILL